MEKSFLRTTFSALCLTLNAPDSLAHPYSSYTWNSNPPSYLENRQVADTSTTLHLQPRMLITKSLKLITRSAADRYA